MVLIQLVPHSIVVMASDADTRRTDGLTDDLKTVNLTQFPTGMLTNQGGQAETSVILPQDFD